MRIRFSAPPARALLAPLLLSVLLVAGCASAPDPASSGAGGGTFPVRVEHVYGSTTVEAEPRRVVALGVTDADPVLALGVTPVAQAAYPFFEPTGGLGPWARGLVRGPAPVVLTGDPEPERIAALAPDLIVAINSGIDQRTYDVLSAIAPVVARPAGTIAYGVPYAEQTRSIAAALGRAERGEQLIAQTEAAFARARQDNPAFAGRTGVVVLPFDGRYGAYTEEDSRGRFLTSLGFTRPPALAGLDRRGFYNELSAEQAGLLDGDVLVMIADQPAARAAVDADPVLRRVPVVADRRMIVVDTDARGALTYNSVLSVPFALDRLLPALSDAVARSRR